MKAEVIKEIKAANTDIMRLTVALLCSVFLFVAYFVGASFAIMTVIFVFAVFNVRNGIVNGFNALCNITPNSYSILFLNVFSTVLHSMVTLDKENYFCFSAFACFLFTLSEYVEKKTFINTSKEQTYSDGICKASFAASLALFVLTVTINLALGEGMYETMCRSFLVCALFCPIAITAVNVLVSILCNRIAFSIGVSVKNADVFARLGRVREVICDSRGVVTENEYSLYDIYSTDGDKIKLLSAAFSIESHFNHSFADALKKAAIKAELCLGIAENCFEISGRGVGGTVDEDKYFIGNKKLLKEKRIELPNAVKNIDFGDKIPIYVAKNGDFCGILLFRNRKKADAESAINEIRKMGKRCVLLAANEHDTVKGNFDILLSEREKVLQEFKKGVKIKAMVISQKIIANADVVATLSWTGNSDIVLDSLSTACYSLAIGKSAARAMRKCSFLSVAFSALGALLASFGIFVSPFLAAMLAVVPIGAVFVTLRITLPEITTSEDDVMFGKINYTMHINGMNCAHCSARVKTALEAIKGVSAKISLEEKTARIKCPAKVSTEELEKAVTDVGFTVVSTERV